MLHSINALKLYTAAKALMDYTDCGFNSHVENDQEAYDAVHSIFSEVIELVGTSMTKNAYEQVLQTTGKFFEKTEKELIQDYLEELELEEEDC